MYLLPKIVLALDRLEPSLEYHLKAQRYDQMAQSVLTGEADIGISRLPLDDRFFEWETVAHSKSVCLLRPDHRLAGRAVITLDDILDERLVVLEREYTSKQGGFLTFGRREVSLDCKIYSDTIGLDASYVANGIGIAIDNSFIAMQYQMFDLKIIPFEPMLSYEYVVFWRLGSDQLSRRSAIVETFIEVMQRMAL